MTPTQIRAGFHPRQTNQPTTMKTQTLHISSTPATPYSVQLTQNGWGTNLACFASEAEAMAFAEQEYQVNHDHPDFTRGGELRAEWTVSFDQHDEDGYVVISDQLWSKQADERL